MDTDWVEQRLEVVYPWVPFGTIYFTIFIADLDEEVLDEISKFADKKKIASQVNTFIDIGSVQRTLDKLVAWANRCDMDFNVNVWSNAYREKHF